VADVVDAGERFPIRLVQEDGGTISLDATSVDIVVERRQSNFGIPFFDARKMGIDLNQAQVVIEVQGIFADDLGQEQTAQAVATLDFYQPQQLITWGQPFGGSTGGVNTSPVSSQFNLANSIGGSGTAGIGGTIGNSGGFSGGIGGSFGGPPMTPRDLGNYILQYWHEKHIDFPVGYWVEQTIRLENPVQTGLQLWFKADSLTSLSDGDLVSTWTESVAGRNATASGSRRPVYRDAGPRPFLQFDGNLNRMTVSSSPFFNSEEFTIFAVFKPDDGANENTVVDTNNGYRLVADMHDTRARAYWYNGSSTINAVGTTSSVRTTGLSIVGYTMEDTGSDAEADEVKIYVNGTLESTTSSTSYQPDGADLFIGATAGSGDQFEGGIYEVLYYNRVLTQTEREKVEGYLSRKYNVTLPSGHPYEDMRYNFDNVHVRVGFDKDMVASKQEPYGFLNKRRTTGLSITGISGNTLTLSGDPQEWFELTESDREYFVSFRPTSGFFRVTPLFRIFTAKVIAATSTEITIEPRQSGVTLQPGDVVHIEPAVYRKFGLTGSENAPVIIIPIKNADTFSEVALPEKAVGPEFPTYENGDDRNGNTFERTDEYITYLLSQALTHSGFDVGRPVNAAGDQTMDKVFTTAISQSYSEHNSRLTVTQVFPSSLGRLSDSINTTLGVGQMPVTEGFSGGRSGKRVKSAGDKVQDMLGILANSNNFGDFPNDVKKVASFLEGGLDFLESQAYPTHSSDYINGIQIPYSTFVTKGKNALDAEVAQRNFFLTTEGGTAGKLSSVNDVHASRTFAPGFHGHLKNGISGLVAGFTVNRDAEMKAYEFTLVFMPADIIL
jgi:hypothetical protein